MKKGRSLINKLQKKISAFEMGRIATEMLISLIESKYPIEEFETRILDTTLHISE